jgi:DNA-directed RNA polymerase subunit RPC12/RpoP
MLKRAHKLLEDGDHLRASEILQRLARGAEDKGMLQQAPNLYIQAARAKFLAGDETSGTQLLNHGLGIFVRTKRWPALARMGNRVLTELEKIGYSNIAEEIATWLSETLPEPIESYKLPSQPRVKMPLKCPYCGGTIRPDELEYLNRETAECPYCGSSIRGQ